MGHITSAVREHPPCNGCTREIKCPGCHDRCKDFKLWRQKVDAVNEKRREYKNKPLSKIM